MVNSQLFGQTLYEEVLNACDYNGKFIFYFDGFVMLIILALLQKWPAIIQHKMHLLIFAGHFFIILSVIFCSLSLPQWYTPFVHMSDYCSARDMIETTKSAEIKYYRKHIVSFENILLVFQYGLCVGLLLLTGIKCSYNEQQKKLQERRFVKEQSLQKRNLFGAFMFLVTTQWRTTQVISQMVLLHGFFEVTKYYFEITIVFTTLICLTHTVHFVVYICPNKKINQERMLAKLFGRVIQSEQPQNRLNWQRSSWKQIPIMQ